MLEPLNLEKRGGVVIPLLGVIFDFDGVIADTEPLHLKAYQDVLADGPLVLDADAYYSRYLGFDDIGVFTKLAADQVVPLKPADLSRLIEVKSRRFMELVTTEKVLVPGARDCIERLAADLALGIASGSLRHEIEEILRHTDLRRHFMTIVAADDVKRAKPAPDCYTRAVELLGIGLGQPSVPGSFVAIEDSSWGIEAANAAGIPCLAVAHTYPAEALTEAARVVSELGEVDCSLLKELC